MKANDDCEMTVEQRTFLSFRVGARRLALPLADVARVLPAPALFPPVCAPAFVEGFFDFQGLPVAAVRVDRLIGLEEETLGLYAPLLLLTQEDRFIALHVGKADDVLRASAADIQTIAKDETLNGCVVGCITKRHDRIYLLSRERLFLSVERETLAAHQIMRQRRLDALGANAGHAA